MLMWYSTTPSRTDLANTPLFKRTRHLAGPTSTLPLTRIISKGCQWRKVKNCWLTCWSTPDRTGEYLPSVGLSGELTLLLIDSSSMSTGTTQETLVSTVPATHVSLHPVYNHPNRLLLPPSLSTVVWDNTCVLHRSTGGSYEGKYKRDLRRTTVHDMSSHAWGLNEVGATWRSGLPWFDLWSDQIPSYELIKSSQVKPFQDPLSLHHSCLASCFFFSW